VLSVLFFTMRSVAGLLVFLAVVLLFVVVGELWSARRMRRGATCTWSDSPPAAPAWRLQDLGLRLLPSQPSGFGEPSLGRPFAWVTDDGHVLGLERDVAIARGVVPAEVVFLTFFDPGRAVLVTYGDAKPMMFQSRRFFLQSAGQRIDPSSTVDLHSAAVGRLAHAGMQARTIDSATAAQSLIKELQVRLPTLWAAAGFVASSVERQRIAQLRQPIWQQRDFNRRLVHCLAGAPAR
jgi:hypothetical protein